MCSPWAIKVKKALKHSEKPKNKNRCMTGKEFSIVLYKDFLFKYRNTSGYKCDSGLNIIF